MSRKCESCGASFETLSALRLHDCPVELLDPVESDDGVSSDEEHVPAEERPPVEEWYPDLVGDLPELVESAEDGDVATLARAIAEYERVLAAARSHELRDPQQNPRTDVLFAYYEPLVETLDAAAKAGGWDVLLDFVAAYPIDDELPEVTHLLANAVGRSLVRTRRSDGVDAIPAEALSYLGAIPEHATEHDPPYEESFNYGWGIGHPECAIGDRVQQLADAEPMWVRTVLETSFYADQYVAVELLERVVLDAKLPETLTTGFFEVDAQRHYLSAVSNLEYEPFSPHLPWYWEPDEIADTMDIDPDVEQRIRELAAESGVAEKLPSDWSLAELEPDRLVSELLQHIDNG